MSIICTPRNIVWFGDISGIYILPVFFRLEMLLPQKFSTACVVTRATVKFHFCISVTKCIFSLSRNAHKMLIENMPKPFSAEPCSIYARLLCHSKIP